MKRLPILSAVLLLAAAGPPPVLEVMVTGVRNDQGNVLVEVCPREKFLQPGCPYRGRASARMGTVTVRVEGVPPGIWATQVFHDENENNKVDRNILGIPREGLGFSNDAPFRFGPPSFDDAMFQTGPQGGRISLSLRYFF